MWTYEIIQHDTEEYHSPASAMQSRLSQVALGVERLLLADNGSLLMACCRHKAAIQQRIPDTFFFSPSLVIDLNRFSS